MESAPSADQPDLNPNSTLQQPPPFRKLPAELRILIYQILYRLGNDSRNKWRSISLTCRQIRREFLPFLLKPGHGFSGLEKLSKSTESGRPELLELVPWFGLRCDDMYFSAIARSLPELVSEDPSE